MNAAMQPTGREISREGFDDARRSGRTAHQQIKILHTLYWHAREEGATRQSLAAALELPLSSVCGRCRELLDLDFIEPIGTEGRPARQVLAITEKGMDHLQATGARPTEPATMEATA